MKRLCLLGFLVVGCTEPVDEPVCTANTDCLDGFLCDAAGACVPGGELGIAVNPVPIAAYVGQPYSHPLQSQGGLAPFTWWIDQDSLDPALSWLTVDEDTGELRNKAGELPLAEGQDLPFTVWIRDSSQAGQGVQAQRDFTLEVKGCSDDVMCYLAEDGACHEAYYDCVDGHLATTCTDFLDHYWSTDLAHCGPECGACREGSASQCLEGACACGAQPACAAAPDPLTCCGGACVDLRTALANCGDCATDCSAAVAHAEGIVCGGGQCDYATCEAGYLDCDLDRRNGCETAISLDNCGACGNDCDGGGYQHILANPTCDGAVCVYACEPGYDSCDGVHENGCEQALTANPNCGACAMTCGEAGSTGPVCLDLDEDGLFACTCDDNAQCGTEQCCDNACTPWSDVNHCGACGNACGIGNGGPFCKDDSGVWQCECDESDEACAGEFEFSYAVCSSITDHCYCGSTTSPRCEGTAESMCCDADPFPACTSLLADPLNCGICGKHCSDGGACVNGACECPGGNCPSSSGAPTCQFGNVCGCNQYDDQPCPAGQYCCNNVGADEPNGCCTQPCGVRPSQGNSCSTDCGAPKIWCGGGCCDACEPPTNCD